MCRQLTTTFPTCNHTETDTFPCEDLLDSPEGTCPHPPSSPKIIPSSSPLCRDCQDLDDALSQIQTDAKLAPVSRLTRRKDPNAPKQYYITRSFWPRCGHYSDLTWTDLEREDGEGKYLDVEQTGCCHGCAEHTEREIEKMKGEGNWGEDPWNACKTVGGGEGGSGGAAGAGSATAAAGGSADGGFGDIGVPPGYTYADASRDDLYDASPRDGKAKKSQDEKEEEEEEFDTSGSKNKGIPGRSRQASARAPDRNSSDSDDQSLDGSDSEEDDFPPHPSPPASRSARAPGTRGRAHSATSPNHEDNDNDFEISSFHSDRSSDISDIEHLKVSHRPGRRGHPRRNDSEDSMARSREQSPPDWSAPPKDPPPQAFASGDVGGGGGVGADGDDDAVVEIGEAERKELRLPRGLKLTRKQLRDRSAVVREKEKEGRLEG